MTLEKAACAAAAHRERKVTARATSLVPHLRRLTTLGVDLLLPPACNFCGADLPSLTDPPLFCSGCRRHSGRWRGDLPALRGAPNPGHREDDCPRCRDRRYHFQAAVALGVYQGPLREAVIRMKQNVHESLTLSMGCLLADRVREMLTESAPDLLVPVPAHG